MATAKTPKKPTMKKGGGKKCQITSIFKIEG